MTANPEPMVQPRQGEFQNLLVYVTGSDARSQTANTVELTLFRRLLALGKALLRRFFVTRAAMRPAEPVTAPDGTRLPDHDQRPTTSSSVFGNVCFARHALTTPGQAGRCPLDAELSLPARCDSDLLREWAVYGATDESSRESQTILARILGLSLSLQAIESAVVEAGGDVTTCDEPPTEPTPSPSEGTILVVQADGPGVPMVQPPPQTPVARLAKGQKRTQQKEAVVTALYPMSPYQRTPQEVVAALLQDPDRPEPAGRPQPIGNELRATFEGKAAAMSDLGQRVTQHDGPPIQQHVALTDGAEALPQQVVTHVPASTFILDIIQATEDLWDTAHVLLGETHPHRLAWVRAYLEPLLAGQTDAVITALEAAGHDPRHTATPRQAVRRTVGDDRRNRPYRRSNEYLAHGGPMGTGVVDGACGHLVNARMEQAGRRWTPGGAQAVLDLRAVRLNGHGDAYWPLHRQQQHQRLYGPSAPGPALAEARALDWAA
jgi:hypothetical protein